MLSSFVLGGFAFLSTLLREYIKDVEDMEGDQRQGVLSIPIVFGVRLSKYFGFAILGSLLIALSFMAKTLLAKQFMWAGVYVIVFLMIPYIAIGYLLMKAKTKSDFSTLSAYNKIMMVLGILSVLLTYIQ
jgi:4-hydroxybenzoate polyprenyltransferase